MNPESRKEERKRNSKGQICGCQKGFTLMVDDTTNEVQPARVATLSSEPSTTMLAPTTANKASAAKQDMSSTETEGSDLLSLSNTSSGSQLIKIAVLFVQGEGEMDYGECDTYLFRMTGNK